MSGIFELEKEKIGTFKGPRSEESHLRKCRGKSRERRKGYTRILGRCRYDSGKIPGGGASEEEGALNDLREGEKTWGAGEALR